MEEVEVWLARDEDNTLTIFPIKPLYSDKEPTKTKIILG